MTARTTTPRWRGDTLFYDGRRVGRVRRDSKYQSMYRVELPDGTWSEMLNLTRARNAARLLARPLLYGADAAA